MITIKQVADKAKVSTATVSRVLNEKGNVSEKTKRRVLSVIEEFNYKPNHVARMLFQGKSKMIALLVPDIMNPFFPELARAVEDVTNKHNYTLVLCNTDQNDQKELEYIRSLEQKSIDGIIIVSSSLSDKLIKNINIPIIAVDRKFSDSLKSVTVNNYLGACEAVHHLLEIGCQKIAHITGPREIVTNKERLRGYLDSVSKKPWFSPDLIVDGEYDTSVSYKETKDLLRKHPDIDGIFAGNDLMAVGALKATEHLGIRVPNDLSIIGFDGISMSETTTPSLSTMAQPIYEIGKKTAELLIDSITGKGYTKQSVVLRAELVKRDSTNKV